MEMPFTIGFEFRRGLVRAATATGEAEWPVHPDRVYQALVAEAASAGNGRFSDEAAAALRELATAGEPSITCGEVDAVDAATQHLPPDYLVMGQKKAKSLRGRQPLEATSTMVLRGDRTIVYQWPGPVSRGARTTLTRLVRSVRYLGRADSYVAGNVLEVAPEPIWVPCAAQDQQRLLRVPGAARLDELCDAHSNGRRPIAARLQGYTCTGFVRSPWGEMLPLRLRQRVDSELAMHVTEVLHDALVSVAQRRLGEVSPLIHGRGPEGRRHVALVALPDVGHRHADGHLLGVGVVLPKDISDEERTGLVQILLALDHIRLPGGVRLDLDVNVGGLAGLATETWTRASRVWSTVTPMVPDRYARRSRMAQQIGQSLTLAGYPSPARVDVHLHSRVRGGPHCRDFQMTRAKQWTHATIEWAQPVAGLVLAGRARYFGAGLARGLPA